MTVISSNFSGQHNFPSSGSLPSPGAARNTSFSASAPKLLSETSEGDLQRLRESGLGRCLLTEESEELWFWHLGTVTPEWMPFLTLDRGQDSYPCV
ncbi:hypothetical protein E2C01_044848 [Portunus trituberculatus]|uniref:Uncharacterized protein n=1 Tax=Portunus trituberculatus TaxID=210409 RepID=A0A5B7FU52_PORTR|nr:hypothetical protein [Portunus trituberculatus]